MAVDGIGARIRAARSAVGLKQCELADAVGVRPQLMWRIEDGRSVLRAPTLADISRALGVSIDWLVTGEGFGPSSIHPAAMARSTSSTTAGGGEDTTSVCPPALEEGRSSVA